MKNNFKILFLALVAAVSLGLGVNSVDAAMSCHFEHILVDGNSYIYQENLEVDNSVEGVFYDREAQTLTLENVTLDSLELEDMELTLILKGENTITKQLIVQQSRIVISGDGNLTVKGEVDNTNTDRNVSILIADCPCGAVNVDGSPAPGNQAITNHGSVEFAMTGTVTALNGIKSDREMTGRVGITFGENVEILEGGELRILNDSIEYISPNVIESSTDYESFRVKTVIGFVQKTNEFVNDTTKFNSKDALPYEYTLVVEDKLEMLDDDTLKNITAKVAKSELLVLSDVSIHDENDEVVEMKNGEYTITFKLTNEQLKKYEKFVAVYVKDGKVEETFDTKVEGEYVSFKTTHLSEYGILGVEEENPNTGSGITLTITMLGISAFATTALMIAIKKRIYE